MSIWQTKKWQEMLLESWQIEKILEIDNIFIEKRKIAFWQFWLFSIWIDFSKIEKDFLEKIKNLCKQENSLFFQMENINYDENFDYNFSELKKWYYKKFITHSTALIDLTKDENEILAEMKPKWRYNIRLAEKKWVTVFEAEKTEENIKIFYNLMQETTSRDNFSGNTLNFYKIFLKKISESKLLFAKFEWKIISAWIFTFLDDVAIYYYWASTSNKKYRNIMAPYLLQWEAIKIAKNQNCKIYDFLWVADEWDEKSPLAWVTDFKLKFTKKAKIVSESYLFINKKFYYFLIQILKKLKK